jgi:hypothetical protein
MALPGSPGIEYPRTLPNPALYSSPCHLPLSPTFPNPYILNGNPIATFTNGSDYPNGNLPSNTNPPYYSNYLVAPSSCIVSVSCHTSLLSMVRTLDQSNP